jgi:hypothetical protein
LYRKRIQNFGHCQMQIFDSLVKVSSGEEGLVFSLLSDMEFGLEVVMQCYYRDIYCKAVWYFLSNWIQGRSDDPPKHVV